MYHRFYSSEMRTVSARELRNSGGHVLDSVERSETVTITRDGKPVAELRPPAHSPSPTRLLRRIRRHRSRLQSHRRPTPQNREVPLTGITAGQGHYSLGSPDGIRTRATALRGRRARPLHNGAMEKIAFMRDSLGYQDSNLD